MQPLQNDMVSFWLRFISVLGDATTAPARTAVRIARIYNISTWGEQMKEERVLDS